MAVTAENRKAAEGYGGDGINKSYSSDVEVRGREESRMIPWFLS